MEQKKFMDIQHIREEDTELRERNTKAFEVGDEIQITTKYDGANACAAWDPETRKMVAFSRKKELNFQNTLNGFWNYVQSFTEDQILFFQDHPWFRVFGEWSGTKNKITYNDTGKKSHWYVYDIFDVRTEKYMTREIVLQFCIEAGLEYIHELYWGPFKSWEHCRSFMSEKYYGDTEEGIVVKNLSKLDSEDVRNPYYLKIVNEQFRESMKTREKVVDPEKENAKAEARRIMESIVTPNRVEKELYKMRDEGIIPDKVEPTDFRIVAQNLPRRIWDDILKEEKELVVQCGEYAGKMCQQVAMSIARDILLGT